MTTDQQIQVAIVDDHPIFRDGLRMLLSKSSFAGVNVAFEAENGERAIAQIRAEPVDIVLMDVQMPVMDGIATTRRIIDEFPSIGIIGLSSFGEASLVQDMVNAGARGYLLKNVERDELQNAISTVYRGRMYFTPEVANIINEFSKSAKVKSDLKTLTEREREVVRLICEGKTNKEIAVALNISKRTVDGHREKIMDRLDAKHIIDVLIYAIKTGIYKI